MHIEIHLGDDDLDRLAAQIVRLLPTASETLPHRWLDVAGAAAYLGLTENAIRRLVKRRQIPFHRTQNGRLRFSVTDLDDWVRTGACAPTREDLHDAP